MNCNVRLAVLIGFVLSSIFGCGSKTVAEPGNPSVAKAENDELKEIENAIAAKEKELAELRDKAAALRANAAELKRQIVVAPSKDMVCRTPEELFAGMPKSACPKAGMDARIERLNAHTWCSANLPGRKVEWTMTVERVSVQNSGDNDFPHSVVLWLKEETSGHLLYPAFSLGGQRCRVSFEMEPRPLTSDSWTPYYDKCTAQEAETLRKFEGKTVTLRAQVIRVSVHNWDDDGVTIPLLVAAPSVDGFLPHQASLSDSMLQQKIAAAEQRVYHSPEELFAGMPKSAYPKAGTDATIERVSADKWCSANLPGRTVEWTMTVDNDIWISGSDPYLVVLKMKEGNKVFRPFSLGDQRCQLEFVMRDLPQQSSSKYIPYYNDCTTEEAVNLRKLKGKSITLRATVLSAEVYDRSDAGVAIQILVSLPSVNGFMPKKSRFQ